jgi:hypothetical protein
MRRITRDQRGSIPITLGVMVVSSILVVALLEVAHSGLRLSRRAGDSANALQLADAGINDAVKRLPTATGNTVVDTIDLGDAGRYEYTANLDGTAQMWHVTATGIDKTGVKRRIKADAVGESLFGNAFFVQATANMQSGVSIDSFVNGSSLQNMCTRKGTIGTNDPANLVFGNNGGGSGVSNCTEFTYGTTWNHPVDGCIAYGEEGTTPPLPEMGQGKCPSEPNTQRQNPLFNPPAVQDPGGTPTAQPTCNSSTPIVGGQRYYWTSVVLGDGCFVDARNGPAVIFTTGNVTIGSNTNSVVNPPPPHSVSNIANNAGLCPATPSGLEDKWNNPSWYYCPGWASTLQIYRVTGTTGEVFFKNHAKFWGLIVAPSATMFSSSNGNPQVEMWGAFVANDANTAAQLTLHYDEALASITTGRFRLRNWREEPISS